MPNVITSHTGCGLDAASIQDLPDATLDLLGDEYLAVVQNGELVRVDVRDLGANGSVMLAVQSATIDVNGQITFVYADITPNWCPWDTPEWFTLAADGESWTFSQLGFYDVHVLGVLLAPPPLATTTCYYFTQMDPVSQAYISEAWCIDQWDPVPAGGFDAFAFGFDFGFHVVSGPGTDPSHRPGVEVNDPAFVNMTIQNWVDPALTWTVFGATVHITRSGYQGTL